MVECKFCDKTFNNDHNLHLHWGRSHEDELSSHDEDKVKKAEREKENKKTAKKQQRKDGIKRLAGWGLFFGVVALIGAVFLMPSGNNNESVNLVNLTDQPTVGNSDANVTVVEFGDYKCPYCAQWHDTVYPQIKQDYVDTGKVKFQFVNYAFLGPDSQTSAQAGECVYSQDEEQFFKFHKYLYDNQGSEREEWATKDTMMEYARQSTSGLDYNKLEQCIASGEKSQQVTQDKSIGEKAAVGGTPEVYVNGIKIENKMDYGSIKSVIEQELDAQ